MYPIFDQEEARHYCLEVIQLIEKKAIALEQVTVVSEERINQGIMIGTMVCRDKKSKQRIILVAVSGISKKLTPEQFKMGGQVCQVVPSIASNLQINQALQENDLKIHQLTERINAGEKTLIPERTELTDLSLKKVFSLYEFTRFNGTRISLNQIIKNHSDKLPPTGTGDCCAPKLLSYAFEKNYEILSMDEVYYGGNTKNKTNGNSYAPCDSRCGYILPEILGLEILYRDRSIVVVNKQSGLLSVPGKGEEKQDCITERLKTLFPSCIQQPSVHRLDMETSGLLVLALTKEAHAELNRQFMMGTVLKKYESLLDGVLQETEGHIELKFRVDLENRPHQIYDEVNGKLGITDWVRENVEYFYNPVSGQKKKVSRVTFEPHTGRTHQLRLASSHEKGLGLPIVGDSLYGSCEEGERLMLHAKELTFHHPISGQLLHFESKTEF